MAELGYFVVPSGGGRDIGDAYILLKDIYIEPNFTSNGSKPRRRTDSKQFFRGTLLREVETREPNNGGRLLCVNPETNDHFDCDVKDLKHVSQNVYELLLGISNCRDRFEVYSDKDRLADGLDMQEGDEVVVKIPNQTGEIQGVIRYKGEVNSKDGIQFGIELYNAEGRGNCDGTYAKERYFTCNQDCGVFLPLNRVKFKRSCDRNGSTMIKRNRANRQSSSNTSRSRGSQEVCPTTLNISQEELDTLPISHGSEVYIFTEVRGRESQEKGKVLFLGRLPRSSSQGIYVGIDLDRPVGNGTGLYDGKHLFYTKQDHAALVPLSGVLPVDLAKSQMSNHPESNHRSRSRAESHSSSRKHRRGHANSPVQRVYNSEHIPIHPKIFDPEKHRTSHSSPNIVNKRDTETFSRKNSYHSTGRIQRMSPTHANSRGFGEKEMIMVKDGHSEFRSNDFGYQPRRCQLDDNNSDYSGEEIDLYGSDQSVATEKSIYKKDVRPNTVSRKSQRSALSQPEIRLEPMAQYSPRNVHTVANIEGLKDNGRIAKIVPFDSLTLGEPELMDIGTCVEIPNRALGSKIDGGYVYGVIKWIGPLPNETELAAGVELENTIPNGTDGTYNGVQYFPCEPGKGHFVFLKFCRRDSRFSTPELSTVSNYTPTPKNFGNLDSKIVTDDTPPSVKLTSDMVGKKKGIQGHHNSCYLDSTLFSLFAYSQALDTILFRPPNSKDFKEYEEAQKLLRESIINPLRKYHFVRADKIMELRHLLDKLGSTSGLVNEEKDPEEFLNTLLHQVFKAEPLHELRQGDSNAAHEGFFYQIFMERDENIRCPSTQQLLERSLISADLKFRNVPVCLILQMPRFGKDYKMYDRLKPTLQLDITNLVEETPRSCDVCEQLAEFECRNCYMEGKANETNYSFCEVCATRVHKHSKRANHDYKPIKAPEEFVQHYAEEIRNGEKLLIRRQILELFAVVCIATSHYVSFAKCGFGKDASWVFFDSMADRVGEQNGYNIPEITKCPDVERWLNLDEAEISKEDEKQMPELKRRLLCDSYMCMYQSLEVMVNK